MMRHLGPPGPLPKRARVGNRNQGVEIDPETYFLATRMEKNGMLKRGQALMLAATLRKPKGKRK